MEYKGYNILHDGTFGLKYIKPIGKGSLPMALRSDFSSSTHAQKAIDGVVEQKENKDVKVNRTD